MSHETTLAALESRLRDADTPRERVDLLNELAWHYYLKTPDKALATLEQVQSLLAGLDYPRGEIDSKVVMARHHFTLAEYPQALQFCAEAADFYRAQGEARWLCWVLSIEGVVLRALGDYPKALAVAHEHYRVASSSGNTLEMSIALNAMGVGARYARDYEAALRHFSEACELAKAAEDAYAHAIMLNNYAGMLARQERYDEAIEASNEALAILDAHDFVNERAIPMGTLGDAFKLKGEYAAAEAWYTNRIQLFEQHGRIAQLMTARVQLADLYVMIERADEAIDMLRDALAF